MRWRWLCGLLLPLLMACGDDPAPAQRPTGGDAASDTSDGLDGGRVEDEVSMDGALDDDADTMFDVDTVFDVDTGFDLDTVPDEDSSFDMDTGSIDDVEVDAEDASPDADLPPGHWRCEQAPWSAETTRREMRGPTRFECGGLRCGDLSHSQPSSWVDIVGGLSDSCEDHSPSFYGPDDGEWNGCLDAADAQVSVGPQPIDGLDLDASFWPRPWDELAGPIATDALRAALEGRQDHLRDPFATVYDLDFCAFKQLIGTITWGEVPVVAHLRDGDPDDPRTRGWARFAIEGEAPLACSALEGDCTNVVCADLRVRTEVTCVWAPEP